MSADNFLYHDVPLSTILHAGTTTLTGNYNVGVNATPMAFKTTNFANNKPWTIPYLYPGTGTGPDFAAKHDLFDTPGSTINITKPVGANAMRYIITGGSGGGGGGSGGAWEGAGENHATRGFQGEWGKAGRIKYSISDISLTNVNIIKYYVGNGGNAGTGTNGAVGDNTNTHNVVSNPGNAGSAGGDTTLTVHTTPYIATGGPGGRGAAGQYANSSFGHASSFSGAETSTANMLNNSGYGDTFYGITELRPNNDGNTNELIGTEPTATNDNINYVVWDNSIIYPHVNGGSGGAGGWGYSNSPDVGGANAGANGNPGSKGRVTIIWLY